MNRLLVAILAVAVVVRLGAILATWGSLADDPDHYRAVAENLWNRGMFGYYEPRMGPPADIPRSTAYRPPLYPLLLAPLAPLGSAVPIGIASFHLAMGVATVLLTWHLARRAGLERWAVLAAVLVAFDPILLRQSTSVMTETMAAFLAVAGMAVLARAMERPTVPLAAASGATFALAALCRPTFLPWLVLCGVLVFWAAWRAAIHAKRAAKMVAVYFAAAAVLLAPWAVRNARVLGKPLLTTTHGGYNLLLGNNPWFYEYLRTAAWGEPWFSGDLDRWWFATMPRGGPEDEVAADRLAYEKAKEFIADQPAMFAYSSLVRVARLYSPFPHRLPGEGRGAGLARHAVAAWYLVELGLMALGAVVLVRNWRGGTWKSRAVWLPSILLIAVFTGVHALYWTDMRMRAPLAPVLAILAAAGARWLFRRKGEGDMRDGAGTGCTSA